METIIKIKCPFCGSVLSVKEQAGMESKSVTCPICKQKSPFTTFKSVVDKLQEEKTQYPGREEHTSYRIDDSPTATGKGLNFALGRLTGGIMTNPYQLKSGKNIIGRQAAQSIADCQIPTAPSKRMSREHLVIEVKREPGRGFVHYASLYKERVNATFVNNTLLEFGDRVVLNHGDVIKLPDATVKFEIPDEEGTQL